MFPNSSLFFLSVSGSDWIHSVFLRYPIHHLYILPRVLGIGSVPSIWQTQSFLFSFYFMYCISKHPFLFRLNEAPVKGYTKDVGSKTTMRITYPEGAFQKQEHYENDSLFVFSGFKPQDFKWLRHMISREKMVRASYLWAFTCAEVMCLCGLITVTFMIRVLVWGEKGGFTSLVDNMRYYPKS